MSVWNDIRKKSLGIEERLEDKSPVYFRLNHPRMFDSGDTVIFNKDTENECTGKCLTHSRIDNRPIFELVKGERINVVNGVTYSSNGELFKSGVDFMISLGDSKFF